MSKRKGVAKLEKAKINVFAVAFSAARLFGRVPICVHGKSLFTHCPECFRAKCSRGQNYPIIPT